MTKVDVKNRILFGCVLILLCVPLLQSYFHLVNERDLQGVYVKAGKPQFSVHNWLEGSYQDSTLKWVNESSGFHKTLVRVRNQVGWELFGISYANSTIRGLENYLFDIDNINAYTGRNFLGQDSISARVNKLVQLQNILAEQGTLLVVVLAPSKARFFHEYLPENQREIVGTSNYQLFSRQLKESNVNLVDFNSWFETLRKETPYPLFPKYGLHWSRYGALLAADSLIGYVGNQIHQDLPRFVVDRVFMSDSLQSPDFDIGSVLNLCWDLHPPPMAYAEYHFEMGRGVIKPRLLVVSDSYFWTMPAEEMKGNSFSGIDFLYYNRDFFSIGESLGKIDAKNVNLLSEISGCDVVVLMCTETNLLRFPWGFENQALQCMSDSTKNRAEFRRVHVAYIERDIRRDPNWLNMISSDAEAKGGNVDTAIRKNAEWVFNSQQTERAKFGTK